MRFNHDDKSAAKEKKIGWASFSREDQDKGFTDREPGSGLADGKTFVENCVISRRVVT